MPTEAGSVGKALLEQWLHGTVACEASLKTDAA